MSLRILVVPICKRTWLYHACTEASSSSAAAIDLDQAKSPAEYLSAVGHKISEKCSGIAKSQWLSLQEAPEGSIKHRIYKFAQGVLSREDPTEIFLKSIPSDTQHVEIVYPASVSERLVRRRLRLLSARGTVQHHRNMVGWGLLTLPQVPLMISPFPNVTLYYTAYRTFSHWQACQGATALQRAFAQLDAVHMHQLQSDAILRQSEHLVRQLTAQEFEHDRRARVKPDAALSCVMPASPTFVGSRLLDDMVRPLERWKTPLSDEVVQQLGSLFHCPDLLDQVTRIRQRFAVSRVVMAS